MTSFKGDRELKAFIERVRKVSDAKSMRALSVNLAEEALTLVAFGFRSESDPYGKKWTKLKHRRGRILQDSSRLRGSYNPKNVNGRGFRIRSSVVYARAHQDPRTRNGWGKNPGALSALPQRRMVPDPGNLPREWVQAFAEIIQAHFVKQLKG